MPAVRIVAKYVDEGHLGSDNKFYLLASINEENKIISGEWVGYFLTEGKKHPCILDHKGTLWFDQEDEQYTEATNLLLKPIREKEYFSFITNDKSEHTYQIISLKELP
jgi:hypothetical protein